MEGIKADLKRAEELISKLEAGELQQTELDALVLATQALAEKSVILRYKAYEKIAGVSVAEEEVQAEPEEKPALVEEVRIDAEPAIENKEVEEESAFDFGIFDEETVDEEPAIEIQAELPIEEEEVAQIEEEPQETISVVEEPKEEVIQASIPSSPSQSSFYDKLIQQDNSLAAKIAGGKIDSLIGAFGLNQRLQFINELFDGSSESFSEAIKALDAQHTIANAKNQIEHYAKQYNWSLDDESVSEFIVFVNRRYA